MGICFELLVTKGFDHGLTMLLLFAANDDRDTCY